MFLVSGWFERQAVMHIVGTLQNLANFYRNRRLTNSQTKTRRRLNSATFWILGPFVQKNKIAKLKKNATDLVHLCKDPLLTSLASAFTYQTFGLRSQLFEQGSLAALALSFLAGKWSWSARSCAHRSVEQCDARWPWLQLFHNYIKLIF